MESGKSNTRIADTGGANAIKANAEDQLRRDSGVALDGVVGKED